VQISLEAGREGGLFEGGERAASVYYGREYCALWRRSARHNASDGGLFRRSGWGKLHQSKAEGRSSWHSAHYFTRLPMPGRYICGRTRADRT
jgi:hypothetical protein